MTLQRVLRKLQAKALERRGFARRVVQTDCGTTSSWIAEGDGNLAPIVVQHGLSSSGADMGRLLVRLKKDFSRVYAPDFLGHGFSHARASGLRASEIESSYRQTLDALCDGPVFFFGNSLGGLAGIRLAATEPHRLRGLMACSPGGAGGQTQEQLEAFCRQFLVGNLREAAEFTRKLHARPAWYHTLMSPSIYRRLRNPTVVRMLKESSPQDMLRAEDLASITVPVALLWGREEKLMPEMHRRFFVENFPSGTSVIEPDGFSHCPHFEEPDRLAKIIARWARAVPS